MSNSIPNRAILKDDKIWLLIDPRDLLATKDVCTLVGCRYHVREGMFEVPLTYKNVKFLVEWNFLLGKTLRDWERVTKQELEIKHVKIKAIPGLLGVLRPFQARGVEFIDELNGRALIADEMGLGKQQSLTSKILTPTGWTTMGKIKVGDLVIGVNGLPVLVTGVFPQGLKDVYAIYFTDGGHTESGLEHLWTIQNRNERNKNQWKTVALSEIIEKPLRETSKIKNSGGYNFSIPIVKPVNFQQNKKLPIHPYLLGFLLGNGSFCNNAVRISFPDDETRKNIESVLPKEVSLIQHEQYYWGITAYCGLRRKDSNPIMKALSELGLRDLKGENKFVPDEYLYASIENRLLLLQGLMDSDGHAKMNGSAEFENGSFHLIKAVVDLTRSLGGIASRVNLVTRGNLEMKRVFVSLPNELNPFLLSRKANRYKTEKQRRRKLVRSITKIKYIGKEQCQCISVNTKDGLYVTDDYIVTHNTIQALAWCQLHQQDSPVLIICPSSVKINWMREITSWLGETDIQILDSRTPYDITGRFVIINYDILGWWVSSLKTYGFKVMIADEIHFVKASSSKRTKAFKQLSKYFDKIIALSGTPIENAPIEIFNIVNVLNPRIFPNYYVFTQTYCDAHNDGFVRNTRGASNVEDLYRILTNSIMIRRKKCDVLKELPEKQISIIPLEITNRREYIAAENQFIKFLTEKFKTDLGKEGIEKELKGYAKKYDLQVGEDLDQQDLDAIRALKIEKAGNATVLVQMGILKQLACKGKMKAVIDWINDFLESGEKLVVFAINKDVITELMKEFPDAARLDGSTTQPNRQKAIDRFQNDVTCKLFIANMQAGGIGITLTASSNVAILQYPWTPSVLAQCSDRVHRMTQTKSVTIWNTVAVDTIEEKILKVLSEKEKMINSVLDGGKYDAGAIASEVIKLYNIK